jgi:hypothetical protein
MEDNETPISPFLPMGITLSTRNIVFESIASGISKGIDAISHKARKV